jgi:hypothetical protein
MPKLRGTVPRYRIHKTSGQAIVNLNGQNFYFGPHGTRASKREYDRLIGEWLTGGRQQRVTSDEGLTMSGSAIQKDRCILATGSGNWSDQDLLCVLRPMKPSLLGLIVVLAACVTASADDRVNYDFRVRDDYAALSATLRDKLETVNRDLVLLWGALDMYADEHEHKAPDSPEVLVPHYLGELPRDPFATKATAAETELKPNKPSLEGWGYRYRPTGTQARVIYSVGLPEFPYLAKAGNIGLYRAKGLWLGGGILFTR